jgi:hypothetical protein
MIHEFIARYRGAYTKELRQSYKTMYGDDTDDWPDTDDTTRVCIELDHVTGFNEIMDEDYLGHTTVYMTGGNSYMITTKYEDFKYLMMKPR